MKSVADRVKTNHYETMFANLSRKRGFRLVRGGWPDFILVKGSKATFVEVKSHEDQLSDWQRLNFKALEVAGIKVMVWWARKPGALMPWRKFDRERKAKNADIRREARQALKAAGKVCHSDGHG